MIKCHKCGTGWTSQGLPLCPICGTRVEESAGAAKVVAAPVVAEKSVRSALLEAPAESPKIQIRKVEPVPFVPTLKQAEPVTVPVEPPKTQKVDPVPAAPPMPRVEAEPLVQTVVLKTSVPKTELRREPPKPDPGGFERLELSDPSAMSLPAIRELRTTSRPLNGPLILGALAYVGVFLLPLTVAFESSRVLGVLGFCMTAFFAPFAPIAWMAGLSAEKRRREQGLRPENPVALGRLMGQWATLLLVSELTLALIGIAALRLAGRFPFSFWAPFY